MLAAIKDCITAVATAVLLAYSTGQEELLWKQIAAFRHSVLTGARKDWGCPSIFSKSACNHLFESGDPAHGQSE